MIPTFALTPVCMKNLPPGHVEIATAETRILSLKSNLVLNFAVHRY